MTGQRDGLVQRDMGLMTLSLVDWDGPIVEIQFRGPITTAAEVAELMREARAFMVEHIFSHGRDGAYFLTCYDNFSVARDQAQTLQDSFLAFNREFSKGDARYGGTILAKTLIISAAIRSESASQIHGTRDEALSTLRSRIRASRPEVHG